MLQALAHAGLPWDGPELQGLNPLVSTLPPLPPSTPLHPLHPSAAPQALAHAGLPWDGPELQDLNRLRCGTLIGSAMGGMNTFAISVEALVTSGECSLMWGPRECIEGGGWGRGAKNVCCLFVCLY